MDPISGPRWVFILEPVPLGQFLDRSSRKKDQLVPGQAAVLARIGVDLEEVVVAVVAVVVVEEAAITGEVEAVEGGVGLQEVTVGGAMAMGLGAAEVVGGAVGGKATRLPLKSRRMRRQPLWRFQQMRSVEKIVGSILRLTKTFP